MRTLGRLAAAGLLSTILASQSVAQETCVGDCNDDGAVRVNELVTGVNINLGTADVSACTAMDGNEDGSVAINELIQAVNNNLQGCGGGGASFADVQAIFDTSCAVPGCHVGQFASNNLDLSDGNSYDELVDVVPFNGNAAGMGLLLVDPGDSANSYLLLKVSGSPGEGLGSQMPLFRDPLTESEVATIRDWIDEGANP